MSSKSTGALTQGFTTLTSAGATALIDGGVAEAIAIDKPMVIVVLDAGGHLKALERMDGAPTFCIDVAIDKAHTAVSFGIPTEKWYDHIKDDPPLNAGMVHRPRLVIFGGGVPVRVDGQLVGSIGVSGGHYTQDVQVANAGIATFGARN